VDLNIPPYYENSVGISDILLLNYINHDSLIDITKFEPIIKNNFTVKSGTFYLYFNIFSKELDVDVVLNYRFIGSNGKADYDTTITKQIDKTLSSHVLKVDKKVFSKNDYVLKLSINYGDESYSTEKKITFFWSETPNSVSDIDKALRQMSYLVPTDSIDYYLKKDFNSKQAYFKKFWNQRDPNPKTVKNELLDEYYSRINYTNRSFRTFGVEGWKSDRGRILIKFGYPDEVDRHPFELDNRPYIIWRYYQLRKVFLFDDYSGFGDFRLHQDYLSIEFE